MGKASSSLPSIGVDGAKRKVSYFYSPDIGDFHYGEDHNMKPQRIRLVQDLVISYKLHRAMEIVEPYKATSEDFQEFHSQDYVDFLSSVTPQTIKTIKQTTLKKFNINRDCPIFENLYHFCGVSAGGSLGAASKLITKDADVAINWAGGLHHAQKCKASGFCYINDIVLAILELLKVFKRVLYVDIDVHHGDGVESAFAETNRVMTVSFHEFGPNFFPDTGSISDIGEGTGQGYTINIPLGRGMNDGSFRSTFQPIMEKVMLHYQPCVIVLQSGADSLSGDRLGHFNLSLKGHADCLQYLRSFNKPIMVLGGGGYTIHNVARCWCNETAVAVGAELENELPYCRYFEYYGPEYTLHYATENMENQNSEKQLDEIRKTILEQLAALEHAPNVEMKEFPRPIQFPEKAGEDMDRRSAPAPINWNEDYYDSEKND